MAGNASSSPNSKKQSMLNKHKGRTYIGLKYDYLHATKNSKIMARVLIQITTEAEWKDAQVKLREAGIILTHRKHRKGGYVCYASKELCEALDRIYILRQLPKQNILISGTI